MFGDLIGKGRAKTASASDANDLIKAGTDATFMADVVEASRHTPVLVDFWAPWCGPCRQLTPALEKAVTAAGGAIRLVKINVDENPGYAGQLRVQSIPAVFAFRDGQPVDGFMGALPESQLKAFIDKLIGGSGGDDEVEALLGLATESTALGDIGGAAQAYAQVLSLDPAHAKAIAGLARCYLANGDAERAGEVLDMAPPEAAADADIAGARAAVALAARANSETAELDSRLADNEDDHQARLELAEILAGRGDFAGAADHLLQIIGRDRAWNDDAARKALLTVFEAAGPMSDVARQGRRRLSAILFS